MNEFRTEYYGLIERPVDYNYVIRNIKVYGNAFINKKNLHKIKDKLDCLYDYKLVDAGNGYIIEVEKDDNNS